MQDAGIVFLAERIGLWHPIFEEWRWQSISSTEISVKDTKRILLCLPSVNAIDDAIFASETKKLELASQARIGKRTLSPAPELRILKVSRRALSSSPSPSPHDSHQSTTPEHNLQGPHLPTPITSSLRGLQHHPATAAATAAAAATATAATPFLPSDEFPTRYVVDMAAFMRAAVALKHPKEAEIEALMRVHHPATRKFPRTKYYKIRRIWMFATKRGLLQEFLDGGHTESGTYAGLSRAVRAAEEQGMRFSTSCYGYFIWMLTCRREATKSRLEGRNSSKRSNCEYDEGSHLRTTTSFY